MFLSDDQPAAQRISQPLRIIPQFFLFHDTFCHTQVDRKRSLYPDNHHQLFCPFQSLSLFIRRKLNSNNFLVYYMLICDKPFFFPANLQQYLVPRQSADFLCIKPDYILVLCIIYNISQTYCHDQKPVFMIRQKLIIIRICNIPLLAVAGNRQILSDINQCLQQRITFQRLQKIIKHTIFDCPPAHRQNQNIRI